MAGATVTQNHRGTPIYAAPELGDAHHSGKVDVYSFGLTLWELMTASRPWSDVTSVQELVARVWRGERPPTPKGPDLLCALVEASWAPSPILRPSFTACCKLLQAFLRAMQQQELDEGDHEWLAFFCGLLHAQALVYREGAINARKDRAKADLLQRFSEVLCPPTAQAKATAEEMAALAYGAAVDDSATALCTLGWRVYTTQRDSFFAGECLTRSAAKGNMTAINRLGVLHQCGQGVPRDTEKAAMLFERASKAGVAEATTNLATLMAEGGPTGNSRDYQKVLTTFMAAAQQGSVLAMFNLGNIYLNGDLGVPVDVVEAARWFVKASGLGHADSKDALGMLLVRNPCPESQHDDVATGVHALYEAAALGLPKAQYHLGRLLIEGVDDFVQRDTAAGRDLIAAAAQQGDHEAAQYLHELGF
eukprot:TRINITY_DN313_c0_g3_i2.p1 TRINITY_DN313_c0_g3~~TRINITY_DN313_c0_g3_i2.p1  ORF type:complete len:464 (-),score=113.77 TRINITY_DN313_c0_g3_i2:66-1325(-)